MIRLKVYGCINLFNYIFGRQFFFKNLESQKDLPQGLLKDIQPKPNPSQLILIISPIIINRKEIFITSYQLEMSAYQHRRNFSLITTQSHGNNKIRTTNRSLRKIQTNNNYSWLLVAAKQYYHKTNNLRAAISNFQEYLMHNPGHQQSLYLLGVCYMNIEQYNKAIQKLKQYLTTKKVNSGNTLNHKKLIIHASSSLPNLSQIYLLLSMAYSKIHSLGKALQSINEAIKNDNKFEQGYCYRAKLLLKLGQNQRAFYDYKQALKFNNECWAAWIGLGDYYTHTNNNYQQALKCYEKAKEFFVYEKKNRQFSNVERQNKEPDRNQKSIFNSQNFQLEQRLSKKVYEVENQPKHLKLQQLIKKPRQKLYTEIIEEVQEGQDKPKHRFKLGALHSITSPSNKLNPIKHFEHQEKTELFSQKLQNQSIQIQPSSKHSQLHTEQQMQLKIGICYYFISEHKKSIDLLQGLLAQKASKFYSQIFYYLAVNQQKLYEDFKNEAEKKKNQELNKKISLASSSTRPKPKQVQLFQSSILNLQSSINSNNNKKVMVKACKALIKLYIQNNQFYETESVIKLSEKYGLDIKQHRILSEVCMMVIKQKYEQSLPILKRLYETVTKSENLTNQNEEAPKNNSITQQTIKQAEKDKQKCSSMRLSTKNSKIKSLKKDQNLYQSQHQFQLHDEKQQFRLFTTGLQKKQRTSYQQYPENDIQQFKNLAIKGKLSNRKSEPNANDNHENNQQLQWMVPVILLFRAYSQYFCDNFIQCLETYQQYENYIKDYLGKQPQLDIYLSYNKVLSEGVLMLDNDMFEQSIEKFMVCVENYYKLLNSVAIQPILFRVLALIRLAISENPFLSDTINTRTKLFLSSLQILDHYMPAITNHPLVHYYYGLCLFQLSRYKQASDALEKCLKIAEECTWRYLYVKGVIQIKNKLYKEAVRQFSAGLLVQEKADLYLGRCICYIQLFDQSDGQQQSLMQKSFEDLQKFIQLEQNKDKISKWVTKILFFNKAYEEVTRSIKKVSDHVFQTDEEMSKIEKCLNIYNGVFEQGGVLGQVLINAFEGKYQDNNVEINGERHQIEIEDFVTTKYRKWFVLLNLYSCEKYQELIKFLQLTIFDQKNQVQALELRYNLAIIYYLSDQPNKADNVLTNLPKSFPEIGPRVDKFLKRDFIQDECVSDLQPQFKGVKRLSSFLTYRKIKLKGKDLFSLEQKSIYVKISLPYPSFFKPDIDLNLDDQFVFSQTSQSCIMKKIEAPWIKKVTGNVQFTDNIISSHNSSLLDHEILSIGRESEQQMSNLSSFKKF